MTTIHPIRRLVAVVRRHIELVLVLPAIVIGCAVAWYLTWRRGLPLLEVGPILADYLVGLLAVAGLGYLTWRFKAEYWFDLDNDAERDLHHRAAYGNRSAFWLLIKDRLEFVILFLILLFGFGRFSGAAQPLTEMIAKWEVSGQAGYVRCCERPIWPGGASGVTWGIGYDGGHQAPETILAEWAGHPHAGRLATAAGITGTPARAALPAYRNIAVTWRQATQVLSASSIPRYRMLARRAYGRAFDAAPQQVQDALIDETYNRGLSMVGARRRERRAIRDHCLPSGAARCVAAQLEASCWVWEGQPVGSGLCARRFDEARMARGEWTGSEK